MRFFHYVRDWWSAPARDSVARRITTGDAVESSIRGIVISFAIVVLTWISEDGRQWPIDESQRGWLVAVAGALVTLLQLRRRFLQDGHGRSPQSPPAPPPTEGTSRDV